MAKIAELSNLFHALSSADLPRARVVAEGIAEAEETAGHHSAAARLRGALASTGPRFDERATSTSIQTIHAAHADLLSPVPPERLDAVELAAGAKQTIAEVLHEQRHRYRLQAHGLQPRSRLLFYGPPGCGKTVTARALGGELGLPVFVVRFDGLVGSFLGQTGLRLREIFRFAETNPCVLLLDEIDAVGRTRGKSTDIGELDRVVISLMQQIDLIQPAGLVVAATNIPDELDNALFRRFDIALEFPAPSQRSLLGYAQKQASRRGLRLTRSTKRAIAGAKTFAAAEKLIETEHRRAVLEGM